MQQAADAICDIIKDYHSDRGFSVTSENILNWANQFQPIDRELVLSEFLHLLNQGIYISKDRAKKILINGLKHIGTSYGYTTFEAFLSETVFLKLQPTGKSQADLLEILNDTILQELGFGINLCGTRSQKNYIYVDDILATGGTILRDCRTWLIDKTIKDVENYKLVLSGEVRLGVLVLCCHSWAANNILTSLGLSLKDQRISTMVKIFRNYTINNNTFSHNPELNLIYPLNHQDQRQIDYLNNLSVRFPDYQFKFADRAFRKPNQPAEEKFFSSKANRISFELAILNKGLDILENAAFLKPNQRPLGNVNPVYRTFGTGTMFFTWRNVSNTCPIVFWWDVPGHNWKGLFPLKGRGN